jgi:hypothetical protein
MLFNLVVDALLTRFHKYGIVSIISGLLHPASFVTILSAVRRIESSVDQGPKSPGHASLTS